MSSRLILIDAELPLTQYVHLVFLETHQPALNSSDYCNRMITQCERKQPEALAC